MVSLSSVICLASVLTTRWPLQSSREQHTLELSTLHVQQSYVLEGSFAAQRCASSRATRVRVAVPSDNGCSVPATSLFRRSASYLTKLLSPSGRGGRLWPGGDVRGGPRAAGSFPAPARARADVLRLLLRAHGY